MAGQTESEQVRDYDLNGLQSRLGGVHAAADAVNAAIALARNRFGYYPSGDEIPPAVWRDVNRRVAEARRALAHSGRELLEALYPAKPKKK